MPRDPNTPHLPEKSTISLSSSSLFAQKSPKLIGLPRPYTPKFYSSGSYMANRPSYTGSYRRPEIGSATDTKPMFSVYTKLPGLRNDPINMEPLTEFSINKTSIINPVNSLSHNNLDSEKKEKDLSEKENCAYSKTNCINHVNSSGETEVSFNVLIFQFMAAYQK